MRISKIGTVFRAFSRQFTFTLPMLELGGFSLLIYASTL